MGESVIHDLTATLPVVTTVPKSPPSPPHPLSPIVASPHGSRLSPPCPPAAPHSRDPPSLLMAPHGSMLLLKDYWFVLERTVSKSPTHTSNTDTDLSVYLHPVEFTIVPVSSPSETGCLRASFLGSFIVPPAEGEGRHQVLYFRVLNKNIVMADPVHQLKFTSVVSIHHDYHTLVGYCGDTGVLPAGGGRAEGPLQIAIVFEGDAFKWYCVVHNHCSYSLTLRSADMSLPSWDVLRKNRSLTITTEMVVQYMGGCGNDGCVQDVADLARQLLLPSLRTVRGAASKSSRYYWLDI